MDKIKESFKNVKEDISFLKKELDEMRSLMIQICKIVKEKDNINPTNNSQNPTSNQNIPTNNSFFKPLNGQNLPISTGNEGVPTDRQTDQQTDRQIEKDTLNNALVLLDSLDHIKKELRLKFKKLTEQELLVFSTLYQLTEKEEFTDYKTLSRKLNLTESSIRDYVGKLIKKGISVDKIKENNKSVKLSISPNLKRIASLSTILHLREI